MKFTVSKNTKHLLAKFGPNKLFGNDVDARQDLDQPAGIKLFDRVWQDQLEQLITMADVCNSEDAFARLTESQQHYFDHDQEHRDFRAKRLNSEYIAQLKETGSNEYELTQFWRVSSSDTHPKTLFVTFETVDERNQFMRVAKHLGIKDEKLGLNLCRDFVEKFPERFRSD